MQEDLIDQLIATRKALKWSRYKLAKETGLSQALLSRIENRENSPTLETLNRIAQALDKQIVLSTGR